MSRVIFFIICALVIWVPIPLGSNRPWAWSLLQLIIAIAFLLHLANAWRGQKPLLPENKKAYWLLIPLFFTQVWVFIQQLSVFSISLDPGQTQIMLLRGISYSLFAWLVIIYVNREQRVKRLLQCIVLSGLFQAGYGALEILLDGSLGWLFVAPDSHRANASFVYHNHLANYLALCLAAALGLLMYELATEKLASRWRERLRSFYELILSSKIIVRLSAIVMVITLIMTQSRMGNAGFFISLTLIGIYAWFFYYRKPVHFNLLIISVLVLDMLIVGAMFGVERVAERMEATSFQSEVRDNVVVDSLPMLQEHLFTGSGLGSFYSTFPSYQPGIYHAFYDHAHNDYLQFLAEIGLIGSIPLFVAIISIVYFAIQTMRQTDRSNKNKINRAVGFTVAIAVVHMALHSTVDFSLQAPANSLIFILLLSLIMSVSNKNSTSRIEKLGIR